MKISFGNSRKETHWKNGDTSWDAFNKRVQSTIITTETVEEFRKMTKTQQAEIKDVSSYVFGHLSDGRRQAVPVLIWELHWSAMTCSMVSMSSSSESRLPSYE